MTTSRPRRLRAVFAVLAVSLGGLAACGSDDDSGADASAPAQAPSETSDPPPGSDVADASDETTAVTETTTATTEAELDLSGVTLVYGGQGPARGLQVDASGVLDDAPYEVEWATFSGPAEVLAALNAGALDIAHLGDASLALAQANANPAWTADSAPFKALAVSSYVGRETFPGVMLVARAGSGIETLDDLRGKSIAYNPGGNIEIFAWAAIAEAGLTKDDVVPSPFTSGALALTAVLNGQADVFVGAESNAQKVIDEGGLLLLKGQDIGQISATAYAVPTDRLDDPAKVAALEDFFARLVEYTEWYQNNLDAVTEIYINDLQQDPVTADLNTRTQGPELVPIDEGLLGYEQWFTDVMLEVGLIGEPIDVSIGFDGRFNDAIVAANEQYFTHDDSPPVARPEGR